MAGAGVMLVTISIESDDVIYNFYKKKSHMLIYGLSSLLGVFCHRWERMHHNMCIAPMCVYDFQFK